MSVELQLRICKAICVFAFVNFFACALESIILGGDAINGMVKDGKFFLGNHGHLVQVSRSVFQFSKWHMYFMFFTSVCAVPAFFWHVSNIKGKL